jgi:hypothetical protein
MQLMIEVPDLAQRVAIETAVVARWRGRLREQEHRLRQITSQTLRTAFRVEQIGPLISSQLF